MPWPWTDSQSRESRRVIPAGKNESGPDTAPGSASTKNRVLFALGSRRRNRRSGSRPIQRSRGPHLNAPPCQPASASHRPRQVATQRRPRAAKRRKPGQWCLSTIASQRRRSVGLASRISTSASRRSPGAARQTGWASIHVRICLSMPRCGGFRVEPPAKNRADSEKIADHGKNLLPGEIDRKWRGMTLPDPAPGPAPGPVVDAGNPPRLHPTRAKADTSGACHRVVTLATGPPGRRTGIPSQIPIATVVLGGVDSRPILRHRNGTRARNRDEHPLS